MENCTYATNFKYEIIMSELEENDWKWKNL